MNKLTIKIK